MVVPGNGSRRRVGRCNILDGGPAILPRERLPEPVGSRPYVGLQVLTCVSRVSIFWSLATRDEDGDPVVVRRLVFTPRWATVL